jgi:hypothetical protein
VAVGATGKQRKIALRDYTEKKRGPSHISYLQKLQKLLDLNFAEINHYGSQHSSYFPSD